jgi:hypothetical protein
MTNLEIYYKLLKYASTLLHMYRNNEEIEPNEYEDGERAINICLRWLDDYKKSEKVGIVAADISEVIASENGFDISSFIIKNGISKEISNMWELITDIICALARLAYAEENIPYQPEFIEGIIYEEIESFLNYLNKNFHNPEDIGPAVDYFSRNVCY